MFFYSKSNKGFTLVELLVVISIISLLSSIVLVALGNVRVKARDAVRVSDVKQLARAFQLAADSNGGVYPSNAMAGACLGINSSSTCWMGSISGNQTINNIILNFIPKIPSDPSGRSGKGDRYVYADSESTVAWNCDGSWYPKGPYILWVPESPLDPSSDSQCKNIGFNACCSSAATCPPEGRFCAYRIE
ncbi:MAG: prepilin-type N-terminal cleavage/methylation domain-containing protein [bacterium]